jgi:hypothetical protein
LRRRNRNQGNPRVSSCQRARAHARRSGAPRAAWAVQISGHEPAARLAAAPPRLDRVAPSTFRRQLAAAARGARERLSGAG